MNSRAQIKLKTKMMILFLAIILVPLMCTVLVFLGFGYYENIDMLQELSKKDIMIGAIVNRRLLKYMLVAMSAILIFTSAVITAWLNRDVYRPLKELSVAMQHISIGDFDYHMNGGRGDEIGVLFNNYEQMRLQLKESEEEKAQNEKKSKELVSNISHDLKTPITSIKGYVEGIMDGVANTPEKMDKYIKTIYNKANDM
ncbi:MAG: HAMP domain-containing protein, partial [Lachnospiraceae bacterium]|nr:HAMP domain-containing protein [Lachnospiraceae bacterium]